MLGKLRRHSIVLAPLITFLRWVKQTVVLTAFQTYIMCIVYKGRRQGLHAYVQGMPKSEKRVISQQRKVAVEPWTP